MKFKKIGIAFLVIIILGTAIFMRILIRQEEKANIRDIQGKGNHIVSLIALHSIREFEGDRRDFLLRTIMESTFYQGLVYCFINDRTDNQLISLDPGNLGPEIPDHIQMNSLAAMGFTHQFFKDGRSQDTIYEFAKPIFEKGKKTGTVRIGLKPPLISILTRERISLLGMLSFFIISPVIIIYYGFAQGLKKLTQFQGNILKTGSGSAAISNTSVKGLGIAPFIENFQQSQIQFKDRLEKIETNNEELAARLGVLKFEKSQIINILDSINFGIIITDIQGNVGHINDYMLNLLTKTRPDVIDRPLGEVLQHEEIISFVSQKEMFEQPRTISHLDTTFPELAPGEMFRIACSYLMDSEKELIGKMIMFDNVTREIAAETATREFTSHLAHELITPLTTIKSYSEMLMDGEIDDGETQKEFYNTINGETDRLTRLIKDLLNFSQIEMGSLTLNKDLVKSDWLLEDCIKAVEGAAHKKNISIIRHLPDNFPSLIGDKDQLKGAIINILGNAVKYTPKNGKIQFELSEYDNMVVFEIKDSGYGISEEDRVHIFDKFYRSSNPQIFEQQGTGLGLAITSEIIGLHDGEIKVQSELGKGSCFTVEIPKEEYYLEK